jgi:predicted metalloprotease with PDZ domain
MLAIARMAHIIAVSPASLLSLATTLVISSACGSDDDRGAPSRSEPAPSSRGSIAAAPPPAPSPARAIAHRLSFRGARNHHVDVEASFPTEGRASVELMMAVWTPGSYLVREYSRHVEGLTALAPDGARLATTKTRKNRWRVTTGGAARVTLRYRVYAAELSVRTSWVSDDMAVLNGAPTFLVPVGQLDRPHDVAIELPSGWRDVVTALPPHPNGQRHRYLAPSFDVLVDSPILAGNALVRSFDAGGVRHRVAQLGDVSMWDADRATRDVERLVGAQRAFWGHLPYRSYDVLSVLADGGDDGGLEHLESTLLLYSPWAMRREKDYASWLGVVSHELFHAWNGKRLRPVELGPFDYENEVYTESLWLAEGVTTYYGGLLLLRAGLIDRDQYLSVLSEHVRDVEDSPGRELQSVARGSFDAWIELYRPDENTDNTTVSYYDKGAVVGFLLDAEIRRATDGERSLDDVMRLAYRRHAGPRGYRPEDLRRAAEEVAGRDLRPFWRDFVDGTAPLEYRAALDYYGLRLVSRPEDEQASGSAPATGEGEDEQEPAGHLGVDTKADGGRLLVSKVVRDGPAWRAGVQPGDEILAIDDRRVPPELSAALARYRPGASVVLLVSRLNRLRRLPAVLGRKPVQAFELEVARDASSAQRAHLAAWLASP